MLKKFLAVFLSLIMSVGIMSSVFSVGSIAATEKMIGDYDLDGTITVSDALGVLRMVAGIIDVPEDGAAVYDVSGDVAVGIEDALGILRCAVGFVDTFGYAGVELSFTANQQLLDFGITQKIFEDAIVSQGNTARLAKVMEKAANGETINMTVIGGSITAGSSASSLSTCYASRVFDWWKANFPQAKFITSNMGIGATTSVLGVHRLETDILRRKPDFIVVEFAVNDDTTMIQHYENLIRRLMLEDQDMAVLMLFMTSESGMTRQNQEIPVGEHYQLPMISYHNPIWTLLNNGTIVWDDISPDDIHPDDVGHGVCAALITSYLDGVKAKSNKLSKVVPAIPESLFGERYMDAKLYTASSFEPDSLGAWKVDRSLNFYHLNTGWLLEKRGKAMSFTAEFKEFNVMYRRMVSDPNFGYVSVKVDGEEVAVLDGTFPGGWGDYYAVSTVYSSDEVKEHTVTFNYVGGKFSILALLFA